MDDTSNLFISKLLVIKKALGRSPLILIPFIVTFPFFFILPRLNNPQAVNYPWLIFVYYLAPFILIYFYNFIVDFLNIVSIRYSLKEDLLEVTRSFFSKTTKTVQFEKNQNINFRQDFLDKILGLKTITMETAGQSGRSAVKLEGLSAETANNLMDFIQSKLIPKVKHV